MLDETAPAAEAVWFGRSGPSSFAMVHRPVRPTGEGVVVCNTLGFDGLLAHRPFRHLAEALAGLGFTVVRLDYAGTGDATGGHQDPHQVARYLDSIGDALHLLGDREGCTRFSLVSVRAGTCLATRYALEHPGLDRLVLWAPCASGRRYVRELRAMARLAAASRRADDPGPVEDGTDPLEVVGFEFTDETLDDLASLDLMDSITHPPAARVLVLDRDDLPPSDGVVEALRAVGTRVDHQRGSGWASFAVPDETNSVMPAASLAAITGWMAESTPKDQTPLAERRSWDEALVVAERLEGGHTERAAWIDDQIFAVITEPRHPRWSRRSAVIVSNTGSVSHTGPGRLHVQLARTWVRLGFTVVRVDLGGTGNSPAPAGQEENRPYDDARIDELRRTIDWVRAETDVDDISLFGICSGAFASFHAALAGADVQRLVLVNPLVFHLDEQHSTDRSAGRAFRAAYSLRRPWVVRAHLRAALARPAELPRFLQRAFQGARHLITASVHRRLERVGIHRERSTELARDLERLDRDGTAVLAVFAAGEAGLAYLRAFGGTTLDHLVEHGATTVVEIEGGDHVFSPPAARAELIRRATAFLDAAPPAPVAREHTGKQA